MSRSRQGAARPPSANIAAGSSRLAARPGDSGFDAQVALALVGLGVVGHVLRKPPLLMKRWPWPRSCWER